MSLKHYLAAVLLATALPVAAQAPITVNEAALHKNLSITFAMNKSRHTSSNAEVQGNLLNAIPTANIALQDFDRDNSGFEMGGQYTFKDTLMDEFIANGQWLLRTGYRELALKRAIGAKQELVD